MCMEKKFLSLFSVVLFVRSRVPEVSWTRGVLPPSSLLMLPSPHEFPPELDRADWTSPQMPLVVQVGLHYGLHAQFETLALQGIQPCIDFLEGQGFLGTMGRCGHAKPHRQIILSKLMLHAVHRVRHHDRHQYTSPHPKRVTSPGEEKGRQVCAVRGACTVWAIR